MVRFAREGFLISAFSGGGKALFLAPVVDAQAFDLLTTG
jgi:hypothetical protein